jgi:tetratricopeptide (TPR) repeat protein
MTVRRNALALLALAAMLLVGGCGSGDGPPLAAETDEPLYVQGLQLKRQGRQPEALVSFLKVIEKRGEQASAESHFEVGLICLTNQKDYLEAIHHFRKYLEQKPNSPQAAGVRDLINTATKEFLRSTLARPNDEFAQRPQQAAEIEELRRQNAELRAEIATWRGGAAMPVAHSAHGLLSPPEPPRPANDSPITPSPRRQDGGAIAGAAPPAVINAINRNAAPPRPASNVPVPAASGRRYRVAPGDTLFSIARKFEPVGTNKKVREIADANPETFPGGNINTPLKPGMELRVP